MHRHVARAAQGVSNSLRGLHTIPVHSPPSRADLPTLPVPEPLKEQGKKVPHALSKKWGEATVFGAGVLTVKCTRRAGKQPHHRRRSCHCWMVVDMPMLRSIFEDDFLTLEMIYTGNPFLVKKCNYICRSTPSVVLRPCLAARRQSQQQLIRATVLSTFACTLRRNTHELRKPGCPPHRRTPPPLVLDGVPLVEGKRAGQRDCLHAPLRASTHTAVHLLGARHLGVRIRGLLSGLQEQDRQDSRKQASWRSTRQSSTQRIWCPWKMRSAHDLSDV